jgi:hypothetical protein
MSANSFLRSLLHRVLWIALKVFAWVAASVVVLYIGFIVLIFSNTGNLQSTFRQLRYGATDPQNLSAETRSLAFEFGASRALVVFPAGLPGGSFGLIVIDRETGRSRLIAQHRTQLGQPSFSSDGERLLLVRNQADKDTRELLTCEVKDWKCRVLWRTENSIVSPVEIEKDSVLLSSSPRQVRANGRVLYYNHDFHLIEPGSEPIQLGDFTFGRLRSISVMGGRVVFTAERSIGPSNRSMFPSRGVAAHTDSQIFSLEFDSSKLEIEEPTEVLQPLYMQDAGRSMDLSLSPDAQLVAFLLQTGATYQYNLVIADSNGTLRKRIMVSGYGFSRPAFVGRIVLAKELTKDSIVIRAFDVDADTETTIAKFDLSTDFSKLEPIAISISE